MGERMDDTFAEAYCARCKRTVRISWRSINVGWRYTALIKAENAHRRKSPDCIKQELTINEIPKPWWFWLKLFFRG